MAIALATYKKSESDVVTWALRNVSLPRGRPWDFAERHWQIKMMEDRFPFQVWKKSAQVGETTAALCTVLHYLNYHSATAMYTLPRRDDISDFVATTLDPVIENSPHISSMLGASDSVRLKRFDFNGNVSFFHLMEGSVEPRMIPVDFLVNDEIDRSNADYLEIFRARLDNSPDPHHFQFSTPTLPGVGIDKVYQITTQNEWFVKCPFCNERQQLDWEKNFDAEPEPHYKCSKCGKPMSNDTIINGEWVEAYPGRDMHGYHVTHMMLPVTRGPALLYRELSSGKMSIKNFYNLKLGLAYSSAGGQFTKEMLEHQCFDEPYRREAFSIGGAQYFMGVDQGNDLHVVIVKRNGRKKNIVHMEKIGLGSYKKPFERVIQLIREYSVRFCVIDAVPNTHDARDVWREFRQDDRVALCHYNPNQEELLRRDKEDGKVHVNNTEMFDFLRQEVGDGTWKVWGAWNGRDQVVNEWSDHMANMRRDEKEDTKGILKSFWVNVGPDHFAHAMLYASVAMQCKSAAGAIVIDLDNDTNVSESFKSEPRTALERVWGIYEEPEDAPEISDDIILDEYGQGIAS